MKILLLLHLLLCVLARPTFTTKPLEGILNYAKDKYLKDNVVTLDDKEKIAAISCKANSMTFTLTGAEAKLKVNALITGGSEWNCLKKEPFYRMITKVTSSTATKIEVTTKDVPQTNFFRTAYGYELCSKLMANANLILATIGNLKKTADANLLKAKPLTAEITRNGKQSVAAKITKDISTVGSALTKSFADANKHVSEMSSIVKEKKKFLIINKCELATLNKLLTAVQTNTKLAADVLKSAQDAKKGGSSNATQTQTTAENTTGTTTPSIADKPRKCTMTPKIEPKEETYMVSYYDKPVVNDKKVFILDKSTEFTHVCCSSNEIELHYKEGKFINGKLEKVEYITGGKGWGCNDGIIQYKVSTKIQTEKYYIFNIEEVADKSKFVRELTYQEKCATLQKQVDAEKAKITATYKSVEEVFKTVKANNERTKSIGTDQEKKTAKETFDKAEKIKKDAQKLVDKFWYNCYGDVPPTETLLTKLKENAETIVKLLESIKPYGDSTTKIASGIAISSKNVKKLIQEIKNSAADLMNVDKFKWTIGFASFDISTPFYREYNKIMTELSSLISKAGKCKDDNEAKTLYSNAEKQVPLVKTLIDDTKKKIADIKQGKADEKQLKDEKKEVKSATGDVFDDIKDIVKKAKNKSDRYTKKKAEDAELVKLNNDLKKIQTDAQAKWDELKKLNKKKDADAKKKMETIQTELSTYLEKANELSASVDQIVEKYVNFDTEISAIKKTISEAEKKKKEIAKKDKELAETLTTAIAAANTAVEASTKLINERKLEDAIKSLVTTKEKADAALKSSGSVTISTDNYSAEDTTKDNVKQRVNLITEESKAAVKQIKANITEIKKYNKDVQKKLDKELSPLEKNINNCNSAAKNWFRSEKSSKEALTCAQKAQEEIKKFSATVLTNYQTVTKAFLLPMKGTTLTLPVAKVKSLTCKGKTITVDFKEPVFIDPKLTYLEAEESIACVDENINKKVAMKRKVTKVTTNTEKKLVVEADFIDSQPTENVSNGASFSSVPLFVDNKITASLTVNATNHLNKKATVELIASGSVVTSIKKTLSKTTAIFMSVDKSVTCNSAILSVSVNNVRIASSAEFTVNPTIAFLKPDQRNATFYNEEKIEVKWKFDSSQSKKGDNSLSLVSVETKRPVHAKTLGKNEKSETFKVKDFPDDVKTGEYYFELVINGVTIKSVQIFIVRDKFAHQQIIFTSPKAGMSFEPDQTVKIAWEVQNPRESKNLQLGMDVQNSLFGLDRFIGANIPAEKGSYEYKIPRTVLGDSRYYIYARFDCGLFSDCVKDKSDLFAIKSDLCFNFTEIKVTPKTKGQYDIHVSVVNLGTCTFTKDDWITVTMMTADKHKDRDVSFKFKGDQKEASEVLPLVSGKAENLVFKIDHKNAPKGEFSWEFSAPFEKEFTFDFAKFIAKWGCGDCADRHPWKYDTSLVGAEAAKSFEFDEKWWTYCTTVCFPMETGRAALQAYLSRDGSSLCKKKSYSQQQKDNCNEKITNITTAIDSFEPSINIECKSCIVDGWVKVYDLDSRGLIVNSGTIELKMNYNFEVNVTLSFGKIVFEKESPPPFSENLLTDNPKLASLVGKALDLEAMEIPIFGVKAGLGAVRDPVKGDELKLEAALMFFIRIEVKLTGHVTFLATAKGTIDFVGNVQSFGKNTKDFRNEKPDIGFEFIEAQVGLTVTLSLGGTAKFAIGKIIAANLTLTAIRIVLAAEFRLPAWPAVTNTSEFVFGANKACKSGHYFRFTGTAYLFELSFSFTLLGHTSDIPILEPIEIKAFQLCFLTVNENTTPAIT